MWTPWNVKSASDIFKRLIRCSPLSVTAYICLNLLGHGPAMVLRSEAELCHDVFEFETNFPR